MQGLVCDDVQDFAYAQNKLQLILNHKRRSFNNDLQQLRITLNLNMA